MLGSMQPFLSGFASELVKSAESAADKSVFREAKADAAELPKDEAPIRAMRPPGPITRNYVASGLIGALAPALLTIASSAIGRAVHNRSIMHELEEARTPWARKALNNRLVKGPLIGRENPYAPFSQRPVNSHRDLISEAGGGAITGSIVQMLKDRYSGSG
jgi:hypothetical protein